MSKNIPYDLNKSQADFSRLFEESPIPMWIYDSVTMLFLLVNTAAIEYYGYTRDELSKMTIHDLRDKKDTDVLSEVVKMPSLNSFYDSGRRRHIKKNGEIFYAQIYSHATQFGGKTARVMLAMDINAKVLTEQKNAQLNDIIRKQKKRLDDILSSVSEVIWSAYAQTNEIIYINPASVNVFGYTPEELTGDNRLLFNMIHPDDRLLFNEAWNTLLSTGRASIEYRIYHKDGSLKHIINQAVLKEKKGQPAVLNGIIVDVTRMRMIEEALIENVRDIEIILESITDGFFAVDKDWNFTYINKEFEHILLRRREDLLGKNLWENLPYAENLKFYKEQRRAMTERVSVHFEEYIPALKRWFSVNSYPAKDGLAVYLRDVSDEKRKLVKIQAQHDKLREIAWIQSHKVRGPVATIMGLIDLFNYDDTSDDANKEILEHLKTAIFKLDDTIREIVEKTDTIDGLV